MRQIRRPEAPRREKKIPARRYVLSAFTKVATNIGKRVDDKFVLEAREPYAVACLFKPTK